MIKKLFPLLCFLAAAAFGANVQIRDLATTISLASSNTYIIADGSTQGTVKALLAAIPQVTSTRTTLAALSVTGISTGVAVQTLGGSAVGDGSGALYYYNSASSATPNGTTIIQPAVGSGRWLIVLSNTLPAPTSSTLGGVFSKAGVSHQYLSALDTAGNFTLSTVTTADVSGLGTMASQNATAVAITGGTFVGGTINNAIIGGTTAAAGTFTNVEIGTGTIGSYSLGIDKASATLRLLDTGTSGGSIGLDSKANGVAGRSALFASGQIYINAESTDIGRFTATGLNAMVIGATAPAAASFTTQTTSGNSYFGNLVIKSNQLNESTTNGTSSVNINYDGYSGGTTQFRDLIVYDGKNNIVATLTGSTKGAAFVGAISNTTASVGRTTKGNFNVVLNVKDYGALGDGSTNDTVAIAAAVSAMPSTNAILFFPAGTYVTDTITITGKTGLVVIGSGAGSTTIKHRTGGQCLNISSTTGCLIRDLTFNGNCTVRTAGAHAVVADASQLIFTNNNVVNAGQYTLLVGSASTITDVSITNTLCTSSYADGINIQNVQRFVVANCTIDGVDDDGIAIGYNGSGHAQYGVVAGNFVRARNDLGTGTGRGIWVGTANDILIANNNIDTVKQTGIFVNDDGTGTRATRIAIKNNKLRNVATSSGHGIAIYKTSYVTLEGNDVIDQASGNSIDIADWQHLSIIGGTLAQSVNTFARGIHADEGTGWSSSWDDIVISDVTIRMIGASTNSCLYLSPNSSYTMNTGSITNIKGYQVVAGDYISVATARMGTLWKIGNNVTLSGHSVSPASSSGVYTVFNNN